MTKGKAQSKKGRVGVNVWNNEGVGVRPCLSFCIYQFTSANPNNSPSYHKHRELYSVSCDYQ